jgi:hypothetical protein
MTDKTHSEYKESACPSDSRHSSGRRFPPLRANSGHGLSDGHEQTLLSSCAPPLEIGSKRTKPGTNRSLDGDEFQTLADSTKATYRNIIQQIRNEHGDKRVALVQRRISEQAMDDPTLIVKSVRTFRQDFVNLACR